MHALRRIHRALRSGGVLLDVHPEPGDYALELLRPGAPPEPLGWLRHVSDQVPRILDARAELARVVAEGLFAREERRRFEVSRYAERREDWDAFLAHPRIQGPDVDTARLAAALASLDEDAGARIVGRTSSRAERLRRLGG